MGICNYCVTKIGFNTEGLFIYLAQCVPGPLPTQLSDILSNLAVQPCFETIQVNILISRLKGNWKTPAAICEQYSARYWIQYRVVIARMMQRVISCIIKLCKAKK